MSHELISSWLQLPAGEWPPDHYTLLGLNRGETDVVRIEQEVHVRMEKLRSYQLLHPEQASAAMNRLAQALICLTDPVAKREYDRSLPRVSNPAIQEQAASAQESLRSRQEQTPEPPPMSIAEATDPLAWLFGPWNPDRDVLAQLGGPTPTVEDWETSPLPPRIANVLPPAEAAEPAAVGTEANAAAQESPAVSPSPPQTPLQNAVVRTSDGSRRGLGTKRALYYRIARTRQLLWTWEQVGQYLNPPRRLRRPAEATELIHSMQTIHLLLQTFPPILGQAGQPGYLVLALARQQMMVPVLQSLQPSQRESLARDWQAGHELLLNHRQFLRAELRSLRKRSRIGRMAQGLATALMHHPATLLSLISLLILNYVAFTNDFDRWPWQEQLREKPAQWLGLEGLVLASLFALRLVWWWHSLRPTKVPARPQRTTARRPELRKAARSQPNSTGV